jgi:hypothetical protein
MMVLSAGGLYIVNVITKWMVWLSWWGDLLGILSRGMALFARETVVPWEIGSCLSWNHLFLGFQGSHLEMEYGLVGSGC